MFYSVGMFRMSNPTNSISSNPERRALGRRREELGHTEVLQQRAGSLNVEMLLLKKTRYFRLRKLVFFCVWEDARVWAHWNKISFTFISAIRASILSSLGAHLREGLQSDGCQTDDMLLPKCLSTLQLTRNGCSHWWLACPCLLTWQPVFHFSPLCAKVKKALS